MNIQRTNVRRGGYPSDQRRYHSKFRLKNKVYYLELRFKISEFHF